MVTHLLLATFGRARTLKGVGLIVMDRYLSVFASGYIISRYGVK